MHVADGVTETRSRRDLKTTGGTNLSRSMPRSGFWLFNMILIFNRFVLEGPAGKAWKEDFIFQMHVLDQIVGEFLRPCVKRAP